MTVCIMLTMNTSCKNEPTLKNKFWWEAGISAPKYYPIGDSKVDFGNAGNSSTTNFDNGWGEMYGAVVSDKYKTLPKQVEIQYYSAAENLKFEGVVKLPQEKLLELFKSYCKNKETDEGHLVVGMAPGGWIRVWAYFSTMENGYYDNIEIASAQLKGSEDSTIGEGFRWKKDPYWTRYKTYWKHFGTPYEAWAENEKSYTLFLNLNNPNPAYHVASQFSSMDGTVYFGDWRDNPDMIAKLPADFIISWWKDSDSTSYDTHILMPKNLSTIIERKKINKFEIALEKEDNGVYGILYLIDKTDKEKILRFKNLKSNNHALGESEFCKNVEYFIK